MTNPIDPELLRQLAENKERMLHMMKQIIVNEQEPEPIRNRPRLQNVNMYRVAYLNGRAGYWGRLEAGEHIVIQDMTKPDYMTGYAWAVFVYKWGRPVATYYGSKSEVVEAFERYEGGYHLNFDTCDDDIFIPPVDRDLIEIMNWGFK